MDSTEFARKYAILLPVSDGTSLSDTTNASGEKKLFINGFLTIFFQDQADSIQHRKCVNADKYNSV